MGQGRLSKPTVNLEDRGVRVSRIRREPPPPAQKKVTSSELREREALMIVLGSTAFAVALVIVLWGAIEKLW